MDFDIVSTSREKLEKFIRELHRLTTYVKIMMYCAGKGNIGFLSLIREIYQNAIDQVIDPLSPADLVTIYYNEITLETIVSDNGSGFPFDAMVRMMTAQHTSKNYEKRKGEYSSGLHGSGCKVVNALSTECHIESYKYDGTAMRLDLREGYVEKGPYNIPNKKCQQGSIVSFIPCTEVLGEITLQWSSVYRLIKTIASLTPIGSTIIFTGIDSNGVEHKETIVNRDGIVMELNNNVKYPMCKPIIISYDTGEMKLDCAFTYDSGGQNGPDSKEYITAFCNMCPTVGGDHIDGVIDGICKWFVKYMNDIYLINQKAKIKTKVTSSDIKTGLNVVISGACLEPVFQGQAKQLLNVPEMATFCRETVMGSLNEWSKSNPTDLTKLCKYFKDIADLRLKDEKEKVKIVTKYEENPFNSLPIKYAKPTVEEKELFIVEGDSAAGSVKMGRDIKTQGVIPIRGKIPNAFEKSKQAFWSNAETQGIATVILGGKQYFKNFDPFKDVKWEKIIFGTDADVDGSHIASLLLRYFIVYMPQLIEAGKVYRALPPLYSIGNGKGIKYFNDQIEFVRYIQKIFIQSNSIIDIATKTPVTSKDLTLLFMNNEDYVYELERLAQTYAVEPRLLELSLFNYIENTKYSTMQKNLKNEFRFMDVNKEQNSFIYNGTIKEVNFLVINDRLIGDASKLINVIKKNLKFYYILNGNVASIYEIMKLFEKTTPNGLNRYKGLGEMDADQIANSTLLPDNRSLIRYTLQDAKEELEVIRYYESDRSKLLDLVGEVKRIDLLD